MNAAPMGPPNSYEVVGGFSSDFFSTTVEGAMVGGGGVGGGVAITELKALYVIPAGASHDP